MGNNLINCVSYLVSEHVVPTFIGSKTCLKSHGVQLDLQLIPWLTLMMMPVTVLASKQTNTRVKKNLTAREGFTASTFTLMTLEKSMGSSIQLAQTLDSKLKTEFPIPHQTYDTTRRCINLNQQHEAE